MTTLTLRETISRSIVGLSADSLQDLLGYIDYLHYKERHRGATWTRELVAGFAPIRDAAGENGFTPERIDALIDQAIREIRHAGAS
jgi:hypothetical protein